MHKDSNDNHIDNNNNQIDLVDVINSGRFEDFLEYITPKKCFHFYLEKCFI